jgi:hypothetical protein
MEAEDNGWPGDTTAPLKSGGTSTPTEFEVSVWTVDKEGSGGPRSRFTPQPLSRLRLPALGSRQRGRSQGLGERGPSMRTQHARFSSSPEGAGERPACSGAAGVRYSMATGLVGNARGSGPLPPSRFLFFGGPPALPGDPLSMLGRNPSEGSRPYPRAWHRGRSASRAGSRRRPPPATRSPGRSAGRERSSSVRPPSDTSGGHGRRLARGDRFSCRSLPPCLGLIGMALGRGPSAGVVKESGDREKAPFAGPFSCAGGGTRTPDTRIMIPLL